MKKYIWGEWRQLLKIPKIKACALLAFVAMLSVSVVYMTHDGNDSSADYKIGIWTEDDLRLIGQSHPMNGNYVQMADIVFNDLIDPTILVEVSVSGTTASGVSIDISVDNCELMLISYSFGEACKILEVRVTGYLSLAVDPFRFSMNNGGIYQNERVMPLALAFDDLSGNTYAVSVEVSITSLGVNNLKFDGFKEICLGATFAPIGDVDNPFTGTFDGNGFEISGININNAVYGGWAGHQSTYAGLFGYASGAMLSNIVLTDFSASASSTLSGNVTVGGIVGMAENTNVLNCVVKNGIVSVAGLMNSGDSVVGGLVGSMISSDVNSSRTGNDVRILAIGDFELYQNYQGPEIDRFNLYAGGIVASALYSEVEWCTDNSMIHIFTRSYDDSEMPKYNLYAGGIVGFLNESIASACASYGGIQVFDSLAYMASSSNAYMGGAIGQMLVSEVWNTLSQKDMAMYSLSSNTNLRYLNPYVSGLVGISYGACIIANTYCSQTMFMNVGLREAPALNPGGLVNVGGGSMNVYNSYTNSKGMVVDETNRAFQMSMRVTIGFAATLYGCTNYTSLIGEKSTYNTVPVGPLSVAWGWNEAQEGPWEIDTGYPYLVSFLILNDPVDETVEYLRDVSFSVESSLIAGVTYQWQVSINDGDGWENINNATVDNLEIDWVQLSMDGNQYRCVVTYGGVTLKSAAATLTVTEIMIDDGSEICLIGADPLYPLDGLFVLTDDLDMSHWRFVPIGTEESPFTGRFNGNGFSLSYIGFTANEINRHGIGLFGCISGDAKIIDLTLEDVDMNVYDHSNGGVSVGGIVGRVVSTVPGTVVIDGCIVSGYVPSTHVSGGIVGSIESYAIIKNCSFTGDVRAMAAPELLENTYAGGIVGVANSDSTQAVEILNCIVENANVQSISFDAARAGGIIGYGTYVHIEDCSNESDVVAGMSHGGASSNAGGIAGRLGWSMVMNSFNYGTVDSSIDTSAHTSSSGGIVGYVGTNTSVFGCVNEGSVRSIGTEYAYAGGIVGFATSSDASIEISGCDNASTVDALGPNNRTGGIAGFVRGVTITDCENFGDLQGWASTENQTIYVGGIAGRLESSNVIGSVQNGNVTVETSMHGGTLEHKFWLGGIAGDMIHGSSITGGSNHGGITISVDKTSQAIYAGGLVGWMGQDTMLMNSGNTASIEVHGASVAGLYSYIGGIVGVTTGTAKLPGLVVNCDSSGLVTTKAANARAGGIVGYGNYVSMMECDNTGKVNGHGGSVSPMVSNASVRSGGVAGYLEHATVSNCTSSGDVVSETYNTHGAARAGGIVGSMVMGTTITGCMAAGSVFAHAGDAATMRYGNAYAGGIAGLSEGTITSCTFGAKEAKGTVTANADRSGAGGLVGMLNSGSVMGIAHVDSLDVYQVGNYGRAGLGAGLVAAGATIQFTGSTGTATTTPVS